MPSIPTSPTALETSDSFDLNNINNLIDPQARALKQGIATVANPYSILGYTVVNELGLEFGKKFAPILSRRLSFGIPLAITAAFLLAPVVVSAYDHYQANQTKNVSGGKAILKGVGDTLICTLAHGGGFAAGMLSGGIPATVFFSGTPMWPVFFLGVGGVARIATTFAISYGLTLLMDSYFIQN